MPYAPASFSASWRVTWKERAESLGQEIGASRVLGAAFLAGCCLGSQSNFYFSRDEGQHYSLWLVNSTDNSSLGEPITAPLVWVGAQADPPPPNRLDPDLDVATIHTWRWASRSHLWPTSRKTMLCGWTWLRASSSQSWTFWNERRLVMSKRRSPPTELR